MIQFQSISLGIVLDCMLFKFSMMKDWDSIVALFNSFNTNIYLAQVSFLNLFLCLTNILPIPALDGGYLWLFPLRRKMGEKLFKYVIYTSFSILLILQLSLLYYWWGDMLSVEQTLGWIGTGLFFYGVWALAKMKISGFWANGVANLMYMAQGILMKNWALVACSVGLFIINIYGIREWKINKEKKKVCCGNVTLQRRNNDKT